jgi:hypothetical protein
MWPFNKKKKVEPKPPYTRPYTRLLETDTMHERLSKAAKYGGMVNANHSGLIDSMTFIMREYELLDQQGWPEELDK